MTVRFAGLIAAAIVCAAAVAVAQRGAPAPPGPTPRLAGGTPNLGRVPGEHGVWNVPWIRVTIDDPGAYTTCWTAAWNIAWRANGELAEYVCQENNRYLIRLTDDVGQPIVGRKP